MRNRRATFAAVLILATSGLIGCSGNAKPQDYSSQLKFGVEMARRQLWSEARFRFEQAAKISPNNPRIYNNLAVASEALGDFEQAQEYYQQGLKLDPGNSELRKNYARFVEFYQGYKPPDEETPAGAGSASGDE